MDEGNYIRVSNSNIEVVVLKNTYSNISDDEAVKMAIKLLQEI